MATYVNDLRLKEIGTGESSGTWGTETNVNLELIGEAMGYGTEAITTNADTHASTVADGSTDAARSMYIKYTGTLDSACTITIGPNTMSRVHIIENATSGSQNIIIKQGSGAEVTIPNGFVKAVYLDGAGSGAAVTEAFTDLSVGGNLLIDGTTPKLTIGDGGAEDTAIVFDGNAQDFYIGLDDSADDLIIGLGSTVGTTPIISVDENKDVAIPDGSLTITTDDNTTQLTLISTDADASPGPQIDMVRDSGSPADSDVLGRIRFRGDNDAGEVTTMVYLQTYLHDASDGTEDGGLDLFARQAGTLNRRITINTSGEICFNEDSADIDFRVESNGNANMLFVDGGNNRVGVGTNSPNQVLDVQGTALMESARLSTNDGTTYWDLRRDSSTGNLVISDDGLGDVISIDQAGGGVTMTRSDNGTGLTLKSTDTDSANGPILDLSRDNSSAADDDLLGTIRFRGDDSVNSQTTYAQFQGQIVDASNGTEDGSFHISTMAAGTITETMSFHSGNVSLPSQVATGTLSQGRLEVVAPTSGNCINGQVTTSGNTCYGSHGTTSTGGNFYHFARMINSSGSQVGEIVVSHTGTSYVESSDYRLKENVTGLTSATTRLKQLQPKRFNFIEVPDKTVDGFLAHEVSSVVPEAVTGEKDAVDADGNPDYQGIDKSKLVPLLVAAVQEQQVLIETLQTKVTALEEA